MGIAFIGGTGVYDMGKADPRVVRTPYGEVTVFRTEAGGRQVHFLPRHGVTHAVPPHRVNYRGNIWALQALGVREVIATQAVGSLNRRMMPGHFVALSQFIDWTKARPSTFFDGEDGMTRHVDMTQPYCPRLTRALVRAGAFLAERLHVDAVYACMDGPRFETPAEIQALRMLGADVVGMTSVPEVVLAREAGLCYASVCVVCNWAAGTSEHPLSQQEALAVMREQTPTLRALLFAFPSVRDVGGCECAAMGFAEHLPRLAARDEGR